MNRYRERYSSNSMESLIKAGFTSVRNPCTNGACSFVKPSDKCARCIAYAKEQEAADELYKPSCFRIEHYRGVACPTCQPDGNMEHASDCDCMGCLQNPKPLVAAVSAVNTIVSGCTETPDCECNTCIDLAYAREEERGHSTPVKKEKKEECIVYNSAPLTVVKARKGPLLTQRHYTLHNMAFSDFNDMRYRDVIRVHRGSYLGEHDTLVVLNNGMLLRVKCWQVKKNTKVAYDNIFQYLAELTSNDCGFHFISLNKKTCDPNYPLPAFIEARPKRT